MSIFNRNNQETTVDIVNENSNFFEPVVNNSVVVTGLETVGAAIRDVFGALSGSTDQAGINQAIATDQAGLNIATAINFAGQDIGFGIDSAGLNIAGGINDAGADIAGGLRVGLINISFAIGAAGLGIALVKALTNG